MEQLLWIVCLILCLYSASVYSDVSELRGIKTFPSTTASSLGDNSDSFSILTKEFLNRPDDDIAARRQTNGIRNLSPYPTVRINNVNGNNLSENDDSDEQIGGYVYDKPNIPFEAEEEKAGSNPEPTTIQPQTTPKSRASSEEFEGYQYPKPSIPFPLPTTTDDSDIENLTGTPARLIRG